MSPYRVFIAAEIINLLRACSGHERQTITRLLEQLASDPHRPGDYSEPDPIGRPVQVLIRRGSTH